MKKEDEGLSGICGGEVTEASKTEETETGSDNTARAKAVSNGDGKKVGDERRCEAEVEGKQPDKAGKRRG